MYTVQCASIWHAVYSTTWPKLKKKKPNKKPTKPKSSTFKIHINTVTVQHLFTLNQCWIKSVAFLHVPMMMEKRRVQHFVLLWFSINRDTEISQRRQLFNAGLRLSARYGNQPEGLFPTERKKTHRTRLSEDTADRRCQVCQHLCYLSMVRLHFYTLTPQDLSRKKWSRCERCL